ncbi:MAG: SDR family oxidoreductase [Deltaproteobacteria bacterium]|nr:SDR family oxidoreductase [Deltaproteobacteria bacterium]
MSLELKGKTALITGASRGIGRAVALKLASLGADIAIHYRKNLEEAEALEAELGSRFGVKCSKFAADLSELSDIHRFMDEVKAAHPRLDIYVANAAATAFKPLEQIREHHIAKTMNITVTAFILAMNAFKPLMPPGGKVITVSGIDTKKYCANHGLLAAAKSALETLTRYYAVEWAAEQIFVHGVNPGLVDTDSLKVYFGSSYEEAKAGLSRLVPMGKLMPTGDVAELVAFLCSRAADWMNGETLYADGGVGFMMPVYSGK